MRAEAVVEVLRRGAGGLGEQRGAGGVAVVDGVGGGGLDESGACASGPRWRVGPWDASAVGRVASSRGVAGAAAPYSGIAENAGHGRFDRPARLDRAASCCSAASLRRSGAALAPVACRSGVPGQAVGRPAKPVPALELTDLDGKPWSLSALRGQVVVLNFWATWCEPCRAEMPSLELLAQRHERDGLSVVAINYQEPLPAIRRFLDAQPFTLPILLDRDGDATSAWTPRVFPSTVLIDRKRPAAPDRARRARLDRQRRARAGRAAAGAARRPDAPFRRRSAPDR